MPGWPARTWKEHTCPAHLLDFLRHFVVFETKKGATTKKIARYQQFEAVNELVDRTVSLVGKPVEAQDRTGLIWHTQGSGKSLTMIFAGQKLRHARAVTANQREVVYPLHRGRRPLALRPQVTLA